MKTEGDGGEVGYVRAMARTGGPSVWRDRDVALLVGGVTVNEIGDWILELALPLYVFLETGSGPLTAAVYLVRLVVEVVCGPIGGRLADTWRLKRTLVGTNVLQALALLPLLAVTPDLIWPVFVTVVAQGVIGSVNDPASFAVLPRLVSEDRLVAANGALRGGASLARLIGAAAGGVAVEFGGIATVVAADAATFLIAGVAAGMLSDRADDRPPPPAEAEPGSPGADPSIRAGLREVRATPGLTALISARALAFAGFGAFPLLFIVFVTETLGGDGADVGFLRASVAITGLAAATMISRYGERFTPEDLMTGGYLLLGLLAFVVVNTPSVTTALWVYFIVYGATGFPNIASAVGVNATAQRISPPEVLGRVGGFMAATGSLAVGAGALASGVLLEVFSARTLLNVQCGMFVLVAVITHRFIRQPLREPDAAVGSV